MTETQTDPFPLDYVTAPSTGTVHLAKPWPHEVMTTICGAQIADGLDGWEFGDETMGGSAATCGRCLAIARPDLAAKAKTPEETHPLATAAQIAIVLGTSEASANDFARGHVRSDGCIVLNNGEARRLLALARKAAS